MVAILNPGMGCRSMPRPQPISLYNRKMSSQIGPAYGAGFAHPIPMGAQ